MAADQVPRQRGGHDGRPTEFKARRGPGRDSSWASAKPNTPPYHRARNRHQGINPRVLLQFCVDLGHDPQHTSGRRIKLNRMGLTRRRTGLGKFQIRQGHRHEPHRGVHQIFALAPQLRRVLGQTLKLVGLPGKLGDDPQVLTAL